jgi:hypothetical protein
MLSLEYYYICKEVDFEEVDRRLIRIKNSLSGIYI